MSISLTPNAGAPETSRIDETVREVIVVGSGPAGYTAAIYAARAELKPLVFEGSLAAGGALMTTTEVDNFPGFSEGIQGPELMEQMRAQAERFGAELITDDAVALDLTGDIKYVTDSMGTTYQAKSVILAMGSGYRKLGVQGEDQLSGRGVSYCATCDGFFFKDKRIVVVGGGDSAMEEATFLSRFGSSVDLLVRKDQLRASAIMAKRAENDPKINIHFNTAVADIMGDSKLAGVSVTDTVTGDGREIPADGLFIAIGHDPRSELILGQVDLDAEGYVLTQRGTATNLSGVFACGDLVDRTYRQAITAAGSGCQAALDAERYLAALPETASLTDSAHAQA